MNRRESCGALIALGAALAWEQTPSVSVPQAPTALNIFWFMTDAEIADVRAYGFTLNVTRALRAAATVINTWGGGEVIFPAGGYLVGEQIYQGTLLDDSNTPAAYGPTHIFYVHDCTKVVKISAIGAMFKAIPGYKYGSWDRNTGLPYHPSTLPFLDYNYYAALYRGMFEFVNNVSVILEGADLDGNVQNVRFGGYWDNSTWQAQGAGIYLSKNKSYLEIDVNSHHHAQDGRIISWPTLTAADPAYPHLLRNPKGRYNTRNGLSLTGGNKVTLINPDFSMTGQAVNGGLGVPARSTPGVGIDIEAENAVVRTVLISSPNIQGNWAGGISGASGDSRGVQIIGGLIERVVIARPRYSFRDCQLVGCSEFALATTDLYNGLPAVSADGTLLDNCSLHYNATVLERGALVNAGQSPWNMAAFLRVQNCRVDTGGVALPNINYATLNETTPLIANSSFKSSAAKAVNMFARYQGRNIITYGTTPNISLGIHSRIETGDLIVNGVSQTQSRVEPQRIPLSH